MSTVKEAKVAITLNNKIPCRGSEQGEMSGGGRAVPLKGMHN